MPSLLHRLFGKSQKPSRANSGAKGVVMVLVVVLGGVLLLLGLTLHRYATRQEANIQHITAGETAHFLAESGMQIAIQNVKEALLAVERDEDAFDLKRIIKMPGTLKDISLMPFLKDSWNADLADFAAEVDRSAKIKVEVWLRGFKQSETNPQLWADPISRSGYLSIESTGEYKGVRRVMTVKRRVDVSSILPPVFAKFTLHVMDAMRNNEGRYNIVKNDYSGNVTDNARPLICLNHNTSESTLEPRSQADVLSEEKLQNSWEKRGWIYLGGRRVRLNLTAGAGNFGEIFHFYELGNNVFQAVRFKTPTENLPEIFAQPVCLPLDTDPTRQAYFKLGHGFVFDGFHDKSDRAEHDAMYQDDILSQRDKAIYGSYSSQLHIFGEARRGFQSRTKVFGNVISAFLKFANLDVEPQDSEITKRFAELRPPPMYILPSLPEPNFDPAKEISDILKRKTGGPILVAGLLCANASEYAKLMSGIIELPYNKLYNIMQDIYDSVSARSYPPKYAILDIDEGKNLELKQGEFLLYKGDAAATRVVEVLNRRVRREFANIEEFWNACYDSKDSMLHLDDLVRIKNDKGITFTLPPADINSPLKVAEGGLIVLEKGDVSLRGVQLTKGDDALTMVLPDTSNVFIDSSTPNHINIVAPRAALWLRARADLTGSVAVGDIPPDPRAPGGTIRYRQMQDPTQPQSAAFYKIKVAEWDEFWHE